MIRATTRVRIKKCINYDVYGNEESIHYNVQYQKHFLWIPYWCYAKETYQYAWETCIRTINFPTLYSAELYVADERNKVGSFTNCQIVKEI